MLVNTPVIPVFDAQANMPDSQVTVDSAASLADLLQERAQFAHWKGNTHLQAALTGKTDIDILVHPADRLQFEKILRKRAYKKLNTQPWNAYPDLEDWLGFDDA